MELSRTFLWSYKGTFSYIRPLLDGAEGDWSISLVTTLFTLYDVQNVKVSRKSSRSFTLRSEEWCNRR